MKSGNLAPVRSVSSFLRPIRFFIALRSVVPGFLFRLGEKRVMVLGRAGMK